MKRLAVHALRSLIFTPVSAVVLLAYAPSVLAQTLSGLTLPLPVDHLPLPVEQIDFDRVAADLAYPNSSQRFFEAGQEQFEEEIQRLSDEDDAATPLLTVQPDVLEQFSE